MRMGGQRDKVQVLVSTYNGEKYLREQLDSLLTQTHSHFFITIRDDGSTDGTTEIIREYASNHPSKIEAYFEHNTGVIRSFFKLMSNVHKDTDYVCFCDQDDVCMPDKLDRGVRRLAMSASETALMYLTPTQMVDDLLQPINVWPPAPKRGASFFNALIENIAVGATIMINRSAVDMIKSKEPRYDKIIMHDWWIYMVVSAFGEIVYDHEPSIYYRQHQGNVVGGQSGFKDRFIKKWSNYLKHCENKIYWNQAKEFDRCWGELLPLELRSELQNFLLSNRGILDRIKYSLTTRMYRQSMLDNLMIRLMMIKGDILK